MKYLALFWLCSTTMATNAADWKVYYTGKSVVIYYKYQDCHNDAKGIHQQKVLFAFENLTDKKVAINFGKEMTYTNSPKIVADKNLFSVVLNPKQRTQADCETKDRSLYIFAKQLNVPSGELKKFDLKNITVKTIQ